MAVGWPAHCHRSPACTQEEQRRPKALAEKIRRSDEKRPVISRKARLVLAGVRIKAVVVKVIVVADVERGAGIRIPAKQHLARGVCPHRVVVPTHSSKNKASELISRPQR